MDDSGVGNDDVSSRGDDGALERRDPRKYESVAAAVVAGVAAAVDTDPVELPPLYDAVDADALGRLAGAGATVRFRHAGCEVRVTDDAVVVRPASE